MYKSLTLEQRFEGAQRRLCCIESFLLCPVKVPRYDALMLEKENLLKEIKKLRLDLTSMGQPSQQQSA